MEKNRVKTILFPLLAAAIWGAAFVFQRKSSEYLGAFTFNFARSAVAVVVLGLFVLLRRAKEPPLPRDRSKRWRALRGAAACGILLFAAANLQQAGLEETEAGKAGFITALYMVLVPVFSLLLGKRITGRLWLSIAIALAGLFLLCVSGEFTIARSDFLLFLCAILYAWYIMAVDVFVRDTNAFVFSLLLFLVCAVLSGTCAFLLETPAWQDIQICLTDILYVGVMSSAVAYTLQADAQKAAGNAPMVTLLLSMESVFSVVFGAVLLCERLTGRELLGCAVMFTAVILAQLPAKRSAR